MPNTNGYGLKRAILYTRVSTDEQAKSGYSLPEQLRVLCEHAIREGHEVVAEIEDDGYSGATIDRPGLRSIMNLAAEGTVDIVLARWRHRYFRSRYYRLVVERDLKDLGVKLVALNDTGNRLADGFQDDFAEWEHEEITKRTLIGKYGKARKGRVIACFTPGYGFRYNAEKDGLEVDDEEMRVVRRIFGAVASGEGFRGVERMLKSEDVRGPKSVRYPDGSPRWNRVTLRNIILNDLYRPHTYEEAKELVSPEAASTLDPKKRYGIWRFGKRRTEKDWEEGQDAQIPGNPVAVAVPDSGVLREVVDAARAYIEDNRRPSNAGRRFWELSGGMVRCSECGCAMEISSARGSKKDRSYFYYRCGVRYNRGR
jgi:site-specific DNA recombinase